MNNEMEKRIDQMVRMMEQEADEKCVRIKQEAQDKKQATKNKYMQELNTKHDIKFKKDCSDLEMKKRTFKSQKINGARIEVQADRQSLMEHLEASTLEHLERNLTSDKAKYGAFLSEIMTEGCLRLLEKKIEVRCLEKDGDLVKDCFSKAIALYQEILAFQLKDNKDVQKLLKKYQNTELYLSDRWLTPKDTKVGGIIMIVHVEKRDIVYNNTLEKRVHLSKELLIPQIRAKLFPNIK